LIDLLGVRYIVVPRETPPGRPDLLRLSQRYPTVFVGERVRVLENPNAMPRAWMVQEAVVGTLESLNAGLLDGSIDPRTTAVVETPIPALDGLSGNSAFTISFDRYEADEIKLTVESASCGLLVISELDAPGWHAYVDGHRVHVHTVNGLFRGVMVPAGEHDVAFRYELRSLQTGLVISALSVAAMVAIAIWNLEPWRRRRRAPGRTR